MLDFIGIGAQKSGTSWLYKNLSRHQRICFPAGKEVHFWDQHYSNGVSWYISLFEGEPTMIKGEITPSYAILDKRRIEEIYELNPKLKLFYIIRNPIERAWSSALMALERAEMCIDEASDQWFIDHFRSAGSICRGDYESCIRRWRDVFLVEQLLILRYESICRSPRGVLKECCEHLDIDGSVYDSVEESSLRQVVFEGSGHPIRPSLLPVLREIYENKILSLSLYLNEDLSEWMSLIANLEAMPRKRILDVGTSGE